MAFSRQENTFTAEVMRKYEITSGTTEGTTTIRLVDLRRPGASFVETCSNVDDLFAGKNNSGTIHGNLLEQHFYQIKTIGERNEAWSLYPNIITIQEVPRPKGEKD